MSDDPTLNLHAILPRSRANGPGLRTVIWFQGCTLGCPGCFNPETHSAEPRNVVSSKSLLSDVVRDAAGIEGVTISGGEPLQQAEGLLSLLAGIRRSTPLSIILFSGYRRFEIELLPLGPQILEHLDVLIDGRYVERRHLGSGLRGSSNQIIHLLTSRYTVGDLLRTPEGEILIDPAGKLTLSGVCAPRMEAV
ncbi:MAG: radical SAM protein [Planctomycetes bacterium]|nr:radical SAM protein [Planctomycetota bacterium]